MKKKSAQDLLNESTLVFASKCSWKEAFPTIEHIKVITTNNRGNKNVYNENSLSHYIDCYNELCSHGGFDISQKIHGMVNTNKTYETFIIHCIGHENMGRWEKRRCAMWINATISIEYKL